MAQDKGYVDANDLAQLGTLLENPKRASYRG